MVSVRFYYYDISFLFERESKKINEAVDLKIKILKIEEISFKKSNCIYSVRFVLILCCRLFCDFNKRNTYSFSLSVILCNCGICTVHCALYMSIGFVHCACSIYFIKNKRMSDISGMPFKYADNIKSNICNRNLRQKWTESEKKKKNKTNKKMTENIQMNNMSDKRRKRKKVHLFLCHFHF